MSETKTVVSISDMARMVGLSRARFYQLIGTTFPYPLYDIQSRRPFYPEDLQHMCLDVRRRNCGIDGKPVMFYARRVQTVAPKRIKRAPRAVTDCHAHLVDGLRALGLVVVPSQVEAAVKELYPSGVASTDQGEVLRAVFLHLKRQDQGDSVGR